MKYFKYILLLFFIYVFFSQKVTAQLVPDFRVNDDTGNTYQGNGKLGVDSQGNIVVVWNDNRQNIADIFCQIFNSNAQRIGNNFKVNSSVNNWGYGCDIAVRKNGSFGICWFDTLVRLRIFNSIGIPISPEIIVNSISYTGSSGLTPAINCDTLGNFIVAWRKPVPNSGINIQFQRFDSLGNKIGNDVKVNDDSASNYHNKPDISICRDGSFIIAWEKQYGTSWWEFNTIYMQMFDKNGNKIGSNVKIYNKLDSIDQQTMPLISSDDSGRFCIGFTNYDYSGSDFDAIFQMYNANGTPNGGPIYVDISGYDEFFGAIYKRKNGDFVVGYYQETSAGPECQRYNSNGQTIGLPFLMSNQALSFGKTYNDIAIYNDRIINIWYDKRNGEDGDIYCNIRSFQNPDSIINSTNKISKEMPENCKLYQNYPNPYNLSTNIKYQITNNKKQISNVTLKVYNVLGIEVETLVNEKQLPGIYEIKLNSENLSTGLYFYTLLIDGIRVDTKKLVLLK
jgi:hypothetical protein